MRLAKKLKNDIIIGKREDWLLLYRVGVKFCWISRIGAKRNTTKSKKTLPIKPATKDPDHNNNISDIFKAFGVNLFQVIWKN